VPPATPEDREEFRRLMALRDVRPRTANEIEELVRCPAPLHEDRHASCSVNWVAAVFNCHACGAGGGIGTLKRLLGEDTATPAPSRAPTISDRSEISGGVPKSLNVEAERRRLVIGMKEAGLTTFNRRTGRAVFEEVQECQQVWRKYGCDRGHRDVQTFSCDFPLCPVSVTSRLRADFLRHAERLPERLSLCIVKTQNYATRPELTHWFKAWRREHQLGAGFYGLRMTVGRPDVLLVLDAGEMPATLVADPAVMLVAADVDLERAVAWYCAMFLEEISSWRTPEELVALLIEVKGRRRFQGFGKSYGDKREERAGDEADGHLLTGEPKKVYKAAGGSAKGGSKAVLCKVCGDRMRFMGIALSQEDADQWLQGQRSPPGREAAGVR